MSGLYKSHLFNFLNRQKMRFSNQLGITWRHLQLATETGVQFLLYPVYLIARTSISIKQQLESDSSSSATKVNLAQEKISTEDDLWLEDKDNNLPKDSSKTNSLSNNQKVTSGLSRQRQNNSQAIAPIRFFQKMFNWVKTSPVATNLNLFGEASKETFSIKVIIHRAIAYFFGNKQQLLLGKNQEALPSDKSPELATMQLSQADLPVVNNSQSDKSQLSLMSQVSSWLEKVKSTLAPSHGLTKESPEQESLTIQILIHRAISYFFGNKQQLLSGKNQEALPNSKSPELTTMQLSQANLPVINNSQSDKSQLSLISQVSSWLEKVKSTIYSSHGLTKESTESESLTIQILIRRAIAYFWGKKQVNNSHHLQGRSFATLPFSTFTIPRESQKLSFSLPVNTWNFKLSDLPKFETISNNMNWRKILPMNGLSGEIIQNTSCLVVTTNFPSICTTEQTNSIVTSDCSDSLVTNIPLEFSFDFWEAEVITVGYAKNLLERILEFLDKITWWLEKQFLKFWQFFKQIFSLSFD